MQRRCQRYVRAEQTSADKKVAGSAVKTVTAILAAGAVLFPHVAMAVSGGGGQLLRPSVLMFDQAFDSSSVCCTPAGLGTPHNYEDLSNKDLRKNAYTKAELRQTNFSGSDLSGVSLFGALAKGANFQGATLRATDLESCDLEDADFTNAVLEGAQVTVTMSILSFIDLAAAHDLTSPTLSDCIYAGDKGWDEECQNHRQRLDRCCIEEGCTEGTVCNRFRHKPKDWGGHAGIAYVSRQLILLAIAGYRLLCL